MNDNFLTGLFTDMSNADYHGHIHIGSSGFKLLQRSPLHFWTASPMNPEREPKQPSRIMLMGTAWHTGIWEPHLFEQSYGSKPDWHPATTKAKLLDVAVADLDAFKARHVAVPDGLSKTSKEGKALLAELDAQGKVGVEEAILNEVLKAASSLQGRTLLAADDLADVRKMAQAAADHPATRIIKSFPGGLGEASIFWVDQETGAPCRIRPDWHVPPGVTEYFPDGLIIDGKSNDDSSREGFARSVWNSEMFYQAAFYSDGFQAHYGTKKPPVFAWLGQERDAPYATLYHAAPAILVEYGRRKYQPLLRLFAQCLSTGQWPGYPTDVCELELQPWAHKTVMETLGAA